MANRSVLETMIRTQIGDTREVSVKTLDTGDSNVSLKAYGLNDPGPEMQFEFHVTETCAWYSCSSPTPAFSTTSPVIDVMFFDQFSNFSNADDLLPSNWAITWMLSGINFHRESKNIWVRIVVDIELKAMRKLRRLSRALAEQFVEQRESGQLVGELMPISSPEELWAQLRRDCPPEMYDM